MTQITKQPHFKVKRKIELLELIHSDICEFEVLLTQGRKRYFITVIDDFSKYSYGYLLQHKSDAFEKNCCFYQKKWKNRSERKGAMNMILLVKDLILDLWGLWMK